MKLLKVSKRIDNLKLAYQIANDQVRLYAEFRWKAFYYLAVLNAGLFVLYLQNYKLNYIIGMVAIIFTILLYFFELRHKVLFEKSRLVCLNIEDRLFGIYHSQYYGVITAQMVEHNSQTKKNKNHGITHGKLFNLSVVLVVVLWIIIISCF